MRCYRDIIRKIVLKNFGAYYQVSLSLWEQKSEKMKQILPALLLLALSFSCREKDPINVNQDWDNEIDVSELIEEFPVEEPLIHDGPRFLGSGDTLYIADDMSTDKLLSVFSLKDGGYIGQLLNFGEGPTEVSSSHNINIITSKADGRKKAFVMDYINYRTSLYDVDSALVDSAYIPRRINPVDNLILPVHYVHVNDTLGFARKIMITLGSTKFEQALGKYNMQTGELTDFAPEEHIKENKSLFTVSKATKNVIEVGSNVDIVIIYDYDGNVVKRIKGPNYKPEVDSRKSYFTNVKIAGPYILGVYSAGDWIAEHIGKNIIVWDLEGNYIATLYTGNRVRDMYYHEPSGNLWMSFTQSDMQFGKLNLGEALKQGKKGSTSKDDASDKPVSSENQLGTVPPFVFLTDDLQDTLTRFDMGEIKLPRDMDEVVYPEASSIIISSGSFKMLPADVDKLFLEPTKITPDFMESKIEAPYFIERMITMVQIGFTKDTPEGEFKGVVEIPAKGFSEPVKLPISGTIVYE